MTIDQSDVARIERQLTRTMHDHWVLFLVEGLVLLVLGIAAIAVPALATLAISVLVGWLFLTSGIVGLLTTFWLRQLPGFWWSLLSAVLAIAVGVALIGWPVSGAFSLTYILIAFFLIEGIATILFALDHRRLIVGSWIGMLLSGIIDLILAVIVLATLPESATWAIGILVGVNMIFGGFALLSMALHARTFEPVLP